MNQDQNYSIIGEGFPLVFQHGLGASLQQAVDLMGYLPGLQLIAMDSPGHGRSPLTKVSPSFNSYADEVIKLLDHLQIEKAIVGGISMGSGIALNIALRYPDRVCALILVRPAWLDEPLPENLEILNLVGQYFIKNLNLDQFEKEPLFLQIAKKSTGASESILKQLQLNDRSKAQVILEGMIKDSPFNNLKTLGQCNLPSLVVGNDADPLHPFAMAQRISEKLPKSVLKKVISRYLDDARHRREVRAHCINFLDHHQLNNLID